MNSSPPLRNTTMRNTFSSCLLVLVSSTASLATEFENEVKPLVENSCIHCHEEGTETGLDFGKMTFDLSDEEVFRTWEKVFDRVDAGEMPPASEERPNAQELETALGALRQSLHVTNLKRQEEVGRVPARRLTKLELGYTLRDLLEIEGNFTAAVPDETEAGSFDNVGSTQRISAVHMESFLQAADEALDAAIDFGANPYKRNDTNYAMLEQWHDKPLNLGGSVTRKLKFGPGIALFRDIDYLTFYQFQVTHAGTHRLIAKAAAYQSNTPVTAKVIVKNATGAARMVKSVDLPPKGLPQEIIVETFLDVGDTPYLTFDIEGKEPFTGILAAGGSRNFKGRGLAILAQAVEGPLHETWPKPSMGRVFGSLRIISDEQTGNHRLVLNSNILENLQTVATEFGTRAFRRTVSPQEIEPFVALATPVLAAGRDFESALRVTLRSMLSSPQFLLFSESTGKLDDYALANRLSYFLWKSMPDEELFGLASQGQLSDVETLAQQIDRMLKDPKSKRFISDFVGQWLRLYKVNVTSPDDGLYPEFDELLSNAIPKETELFIAHMLENNLGVDHLVDSDFTFLNRRLARHYGIEGVEGQDFQKVTLPKDSPRGGVLTQAAILKTTANGTTTSPVTRGNFVLTNFLGTPPSPPPPDVGSIEPDTRGQTTIREILEAHREIETCNQCHKQIDPPGFALESFDPIGGFRTNYRVSGGEQEFDGFVNKLPPKPGRQVDASGTTASGQEFDGIVQFKQHLLNEREQIARNLVSKLAVYATGGEIQFADREIIEEILDKHAANGYPLRDLIHSIVQSRIFLHK